MMMREPSGIDSPGQAIGVARAVPPLVGGAHQRRNVGKGGRGGDDALARDRVLVHEAPLVGGERPGLVQDRLRDRDLADVVQLGGNADGLHLRRLTPERRGDARRQLGHVVDVIGQLRVAVRQR